jgi:hypothetical protein
VLWLWLRVLHDQLKCGLRGREPAAAAAEMVMVSDEFVIGMVVVGD